MIEEASSVISCIVDMTNAIYSLGLPADMNQLQGEAFHKSDAVSGNKRKNRAAVHVVEPDCIPAIVSPNLNPMSNHDLPLGMEEFDLQHHQDEEDNSSAFSPETLIDYVLYETDNSVLSPPSPPKKAKVDMTKEAAKVLPLPAGMAAQVN